MLTNLLWNSDESGRLTCYADHKKTAITFHFNDSDEVTWFSVDQTEFDPTTENIFDLFVCINGEFVSLYELMLKAQEDHPDIRISDEEDAMNEAEWRREISSPEATGRI